MSKPACYHRAVIPSGRAARCFVAVCALTCSFIALPHALPAALSFDNLLADLTAAVVGALRHNEPVQVVAADVALGRDLRARLERRGVRVVDVPSADAAVVAVTCADTLTERLCAAEVRRGDTRELVTVQRRFDGHTSAGAHSNAPLAIPLVLELRPLLADATPILDAASIGPHLLVLHPSALARYQRAGDAWRLHETRPILSKRPWPRDLRGRVLVDGNRLEVFLPGVSCRGAADPFELTCGDEERPWPVAFENSGMARDRNYVVSPEGERYYAVVPLGSEAGARWLAATSDGRLVFLDDSRKHIDPPAGAADDVAGVVTACASGDLVLVPVPSAVQGDGDALRLFRVTGRRLVAVTPPAALPGVVTALWAGTGAKSATAVCHNPMTGLYEAFQVGVSCGR